MIIEHKRINKEVSEENNIPEEIIKSISDKVFTSWNKWTKNPDTLVLKIRGLGKSYYRKKKVLDKICEFDYLEDTFSEEFKRALLFVRDEYEKYTEEKQKFRNDYKDFK